MTVPAKLAAFAVVLGLSFGAGAAVGAMAGPIDVDDAPDHSQVGDDHADPSTGGDLPAGSSTTTVAPDHSPGSHP